MKGLLVCRVAPRLIVAAAAIYGVLMAVMAPRQAPSSSLEALLRGSLVIFAVIGASFLTVSTASLLLHGFDGHVPRPRRLNGVRIVFSVVSRGDDPRLLRRCLSSLRYWVRRLEPVYGFRGVIELVCDVDPGEDVRRLADRFVLVPAGYRTARGSLFKARALQYSVEARVRDGLVGDDTWIYHIDDDTIIG
ncbi:MAG: hypothetical protein GXO09_05230, partial [Crenarchaeota archaeon]|nr:hypothetical protein [Thermoproteota archaeon]